MALQSMRKFKKLLKGGSKAKMSAADWREIRGMLGSDAGAGVRKKANPGARRMTKTQRRANAAKRAKKGRVARALKKFLASVAPAKKYGGAEMRKNPGGSITITPIKLPYGQGPAESIAELVAAQRASAKAPKKRKAVRRRR